MNKILNAEQQKKLAELVAKATPERGRPGAGTDRPRRGAGAAAPEGGAKPEGNPGGAGEPKPDGLIE